MSILNIHKVTKIGIFHTDYCEDYAFYGDIGQDKILISVFDGCTMGHESYFASSLIGKLTRKITREEYYKEYVDKKSIGSKELLKRVSKRLFEDLKDLKNQLNLDRNEILSTVLLGIIDVKERSVELIVIGDGLISVGKELIELEQDNVPDYIGYHLNEDFEFWYDAQDQKFSFEDVNDVSISTDGIFTFSKFENKYYPDISNKEVVEYLLSDISEIENERMFEKKLHRIEKEWGLKPTDDLGIVRIRLN